MFDIYFQGIKTHNVVAILGGLLFRRINVDFLFTYEVIIVTELLSQALFQVFTCELACLVLTAMPGIHG